MKDQIREFDATEERQATLDALERLRQQGADLTIERDVDFHVAAPSEADSQAIAREADVHGFAVRIVAEDEGDWTVWCTKRLVLTEPAITATEVLLNSIAEPFGGYSDGWGTPIPA